jgi:ADP-heptose:LPS heptosyltransferase
LNTARAITTTDQVITVDTAVAHLSSALGTPTSIFIPAPPDWRWALQSKSNPWYPKTNLIRNKSISDPLLK